MSLIKPSGMVVGIAIAIAVLIPARLLQDRTEPLGALPAPAAIEVDLAESQPLSVALSAPPFTTGRLPSPNGDGGAIPEAANQEEVPAAVPPPRLVGLVVQERGRAVALVKGSAGETLTLARGQAVDGWTVVGIGRDLATFEREGTRHVARLDFARAGTDALPAAPAPRPAAVPATFAGPPSGRQDSD